MFEALNVSRLRTRGAPALRAMLAASVCRVLVCVRVASASRPRRSAAGGTPGVR